MKHMQMGDNYAVVTSKGVKTFSQTHTNYEILVECLTQDNEEDFLISIDIGPSITNWSDGEFKLVGGSITYRGEEIPTVIGNIIIDMINQKKDSSYLLNFLKNLYENPSYHAVQGLYDWISHRSLAFTQDGHFLTYKYVTESNRENYTDKMGREVKAGDFVDQHSMTYRNNIGDKNVMPRYKVNDNRNAACEAGFHVGTLSYVKGQKYIVICKVNPKNVVSIPHDCNCQKIRCCEYEVVKLFTEELGIVE
jgi:hypothetical protein